ncbi:MAG TPA: universal stress protein [Labilithrix sp.]|nr:universal stress protein [Labilithrix sp.]
MIAFKNILVPVDFSEPSNRALEVAIDLAKQYDASLTVLHVFDVPLAYAGMGMSPIDLLTPMVEAARKQLDATLAETRGSISSATAILAQGTPWREILDAIPQRHADLIVMGTHGRRGVGRALLGSVTEKVVRLSPVPVLTVRPPHAEAESPAVTG